MLQLQAKADLRVGDHPFVQKQMVGGDLAAVPGDRLQPASAERAQPAHRAPDRDAGMPDTNDRRQPLGQQMPAGPGRADPPGGGVVIGVRRGFEHCRRRRAGARELKRDQIEEWPLPGQHRPPFGHEVGGLEENLRGADRHHSRQGPTRDRHRALDRAGRQQDFPGGDGLAGSRGGQRQRAAEGTGGIDVPYRRPRPIVRLARTQRRHERPPGQIIGAERRAVRGALDGAIDLPAGSLRFVDQQRVEAMLGSQRRRCHAGRSGADNGEIVGHSISMARAPRWRRMRMPGRAATMQLCRLGMPSISARQSKQMPIMQ